MWARQLDERIAGTFAPLNVTDAVSISRPIKRSRQHDGQYQSIANTMV